MTDLEKNWTFAKEANLKMELIDLKRSLFKFREAANVLLYNWNRAESNADIQTLGLANKNQLLMVQDALAFTYPKSWGSFEDVVHDIDEWGIDASNELDKLIKG